jgi:hypothetical protein
MAMRLGCVWVTTMLLLGAVHALDVSWTQAADRAPFKLGVQATRFLPTAMVGQWQITSRLMETNAPDIFYRPVVQDIWLLAQDAHTVTLTNPVTGATVTIEVQNVRGNTASFHHREVDPVRPGRTFDETPTITVEGNRLTGQNLAIYEERNARGQLRRRATARFALEGRRLSGPGVRFGDAVRPALPELDILPIQPDWPGGAARRWP